MGPKNNKGILDRIQDALDRRARRRAHPDRPDASSTTGEHPLNRLDSEGELSRIWDPNIFHPLGHQTLGQVPTNDAQLLDTVRTVIAHHEAGGVDGGSGALLDHHLDAQHDLYQALTQAHYLTQTDAALDLFGQEAGAAAKYEARLADLINDLTAAHAEHANARDHLLGRDGATPRWSPGPGTNPALPTIAPAPGAAQQHRTLPAHATPAAQNATAQTIAAHAAATNTANHTSTPETQPATSTPPPASPAPTATPVPGTGTSADSWATPGPAVNPASNGATKHPTPTH